MKIIIQGNYKQEGCKGSECSPNNQLKNLFDSIITSNSGLASKWIDDNEVVIDQRSSLELHNFLLKAEQLGRTIQYSKQTVINIED